MWPRAEAHGNLRDARVYLGWEYPLQCGRGPKPTEIGRSMATTITAAELQCGRGPKPTEI